MSRWTPSYNPKNLQEVELWAEKTRVAKRRLAVLIASTLSLILLGLATRAGAVFVWAGSALILVAWVGMLDYFSPERCIERVWRRTQERYPGEIREGQPTQHKGTLYRPGSQKDYFGRMGVGIGVWRNRGGRWVRTGWAERPEWFRREAAAEAYMDRLGQELSGGGDKR